MGNYISLSSSAPVTVTTTTTDSTIKIINQNDNDNHDDSLNVVISSDLIDPTVFIKSPEDQEVKKEDQEVKTKIQYDDVAFKKQLIKHNTNKKNKNNGKKIRTMVKKIIKNINFFSFPIYYSFTYLN